MKKVLITLSAFAVALMITLSSYSACPCQVAAPATPCCETPKPCCETPAPCECAKPVCSCAPKCCNCDIIDLDKACSRTSFDVIAYSSKLSRYERIIKQAGMEDYFTCGNYIAFIPINCALACVKFKCPDTAKKFVLEHLADAKCYPNDLCTYSTIKTLCGKEFCITRDCNTTRVGKSVVIVDNVKTQNGTIYILDRKLK